MQCHAACTLHTQLAVPCSTGIRKALQGFLQLMHRDSLYSLLILRTELTKTHVKAAENHTQVLLKAQMPAQKSHGFCQLSGPLELAELATYTKTPEMTTSSDLIAPDTHVSTQQLTSSHCRSLLH